MTTRAYAPADREAAAAALGDARPLDSPRVHAHVAEEGPAGGIALWAEPRGRPGRAGLPVLGPVLAPGEIAGRRFYALVLACAEDALTRGHRRGSFTLKDERLLRVIEDTFRVEPREAGWAPVTGEAVAWEIEVDLRDAVEQLRAVLGTTEER
jgi:hypothetical protein